MPLMRYFLFVGGVLLALVYISDWVLPKLPAADIVAGAGPDKPFIRIDSERKWPERVVFDTSVPTISPALAKTDMAKADIPRAEVAGPAPATLADGSGVRVRDAFALMGPPEPKKLASKPLPKRKIAKKRVAPSTVVVVAQQPRFGLFGNPL